MLQTKLRTLTEILSQSIRHPSIIKGIFKVSEHRGVTRSNILLNQIKTQGVELNLYHVKLKKSRFKKDFFLLEILDKSKIIVSNPGKTFLTGYAYSYYPYYQIRIEKDHKKDDGLRYPKAHRKKRSKRLKIIYDKTYKPHHFFLQIAVYLVQLGIIPQESIQEDFIAYVLELAGFSNKIIKQGLKTALESKNLYPNITTERQYYCYRHRPFDIRWQLYLFATFRERKDIQEQLNKALEYVVKGYHSPYNANTFGVYTRSAVVGMLKIKKFASRISPEKSRKRDLVLRYAKERKVSRDTARKWLYRKLKKQSLEEVEIEFDYPKGHFKNWPKKIKHYLFQYPAEEPRKVKVSHLGFIRKKKGYTTEELANESKIPPWKLKDIERGRYHPTPLEFVRIHKVVMKRVSVAYDEAQKCPIFKL